MEKIRDIIIKNFTEFGNKIAFKCGNREISYCNLLKESLKISEYLKHSNYKSIGINLENRIDIMVVSIGCLIARVPFIIVDKSYPENFLNNILEQAKIQIVITEDENKNNYNEIFLKKLYSKTQNPYKEISQNENQEERTLFYIATSGSTGAPKIAKRDVESFIFDYREMKRKFPFLFGRILQQYAKLNFAYGFENTLIFLLGGMTICFPKENVSISEYEKMFLEIEENKAEIVFWASPILKLFSKHPKLCENIPSTLRYIYTGGEPVVISADLVVEFWNKNIKIVNDYGCSELGKMFTHLFEIDLKDMEQYNMIGVGKPLKNYEAIIINEKNEIADEGYLYIASKDKFNCGYVNNDVEIIQRDGYWLYDTKDIARRKKGNIYVLGRGVNSVNVAGYRIEVEQIEILLREIKEIESCIVIPYENNYKENILYCLYKGKIQENQLREKAEKIMPSYMIPKVFFMVDTIELLQNGKLDRVKNREKLLNLLTNEKELLVLKETKERVISYLNGVMGSKYSEVSGIYAKPFKEYGIDSLTLVDFISTIEKKENIKIPVTQLVENINNLKDIVDYIINYKQGEITDEN